MSKATQAVNAMISNSEKITDVKKASNGYVFLYNKKYVWSVFHNEQENTYEVAFYPEQNGVHLVAFSIDNFESNEINSIVYTSEELGTKESYKTFSELYRLVKEKLFGVDKVLDDIIEDDSVF